MNINATLGAGTYFIEVQPNSADVNSSYALELTATLSPASIPSDPGNTLNTAYNIGNLTGTNIFNEFVGVVDAVDYYRFTLAATSAISLRLNGLTQSGVYSRIIYDKNNNGLIDSGETLYSGTASTFSNSNNLNINATLGAGNYFIEVKPNSANVNSNYALELTATPSPASIPSDPGNTLNTAYNIGNLTGTNIFNEFVGVVDPVDYYRFTLAATSAISLRLNGLTQSGVYSRIIYDKNNNGLIDSGETLYSGTASTFSNSNNLNINATLGAGNYFIEVKPNSANVNSNYALELTATPSPASIPSDPGNTLNTAYNIGNLTGTNIFNEFVGVVDPVDYYRFTLAATSAISLRLNGLTQSGVYSRIIYDQNNNGLIDSGETLYSGTASRFSNSNNLNINATLGAGNYFIEVKPNSANVNSSYALQLTAPDNNLDNVVTGTANNENFTTTSQKDIIDAQGGNDTITSTFANLQQNDTLNGGTGIDTLIITGGSSANAITINTNNTNQFNIPGTTIIGFERFDLSGFSGKVSFFGNSGNDWIKAGAGNDILNGKAGADTMIGGAGNDFYYVDHVGDTIIENVGEGTDTVFSTISYTLGNHLENLTLQGTSAINGTGNNLNNHIKGNAVANI